MASEPNTSTNKPTESDTNTNADDPSPSAEQEKLASDTSAEHESSEEGASSRFFNKKIFNGMREDLAARIGLYKDDWKR